MKKDINFLKQQLEKDYELEKTLIKQRIKELEDEFDLIDERLKNLDTIKEQDFGKIMPLITVKTDNEQSYFYIYFRIGNRKWTKTLKEGLDFSLTFTEEDIKYIIENKNNICETALKYIMNKKDYEHYLFLRG